jgi:molybdate transport system substrate-binding protein
MRFFKTIFALLAVWTLPAFAQPITVSAAISLKDALTGIVQQYQSQTGEQVKLNFGASGQLAAQITQGAPVDAFISAGKREMDQLSAAGLIDPATRRTICGNELVLIVPADATFAPGSFADLTDVRVQRIAVGQPRTVPAGLYAQEVFDHLKISAAIAPKEVYGENVRQVLDYAAAGEVDGAVVYSTDVAAAGAKVRVVARADPSLHDPIVYPAAVIKQSGNAEAARQFLDYLGTAPARQALAAQGFVVTGPSTAPSP